MLYGLDASGEYLCGISGEELFDFGIDNDIINQVYISCNGYIYSGCNYDYETLDNNISPDNSLESIQSLLVYVAHIRKRVNLYDCHYMWTDEKMECCFLNHRRRARIKNYGFVIKENEMVKRIDE